VVVRSLSSIPSEGTRTEKAAPSWAVLLAVTSTVGFTASAYVGIRHLRDSFSPGSMSLGRLVVGSLVLGLVVLMCRSWRAMSRRDWAVTVATGLLLFGAYNLAINAGASRVDAGTAAFVSQVSPVAIALLAAVVLRERLTMRAVVGMALAFGGVTIIAFGASSGVEGDLLGVLLCLAAALSYAVGAVLEKPLVARLPALQITWIACTVGALVSLPFGDTLRREALLASTLDLGWLIFLGVGPTAAAFTTFAYALKYMNAGALGITTYLTPPLTIVLSVVILAETPPSSAYLGGALSLLGVAVAQQSTRLPRTTRPS
jgi:drug/metabolite transporter (DMT)-like permease